MSILKYEEYLKNICIVATESAAHSSSAVYSLDVIERKLDKLLRLLGVNPMSEEFNPAVDALLAEVRHA